MKKRIRLLIFPELAFTDSFGILKTRNNAPLQKRLIWSTGKRKRPKLPKNKVYASMDVENLSFNNRSHPPIPLYKKIKRLILGKVNSGEWGPNYKIPSESVLGEMTGASRMTISRALRELTEQGVLVRSQGLGTFVSSYKAESSLIVVRDIADEIDSRNRVHSSKVLLVKKLRADSLLAPLFAVMAEYTLYHSVILHYEDSVPLLLESRYVNPAAAPEYMEQDFERTTPTAYLNSIIPFSKAEHIVEAVSPSDQERSWLEIPEQEPCLQIRRRTWIDELVVTAAKLIYPGSRYRLEGYFHP